MLYHNTVEVFRTTQTVPAIDEVLDEYLLDCVSGGLKPKTLQIYGGNLGRLSEHLHARACRRFDDVTPKDMRLFFAYLQSRELSPYTVDQYWRTISTFFKWCRQHGHMSDNPLEFVRRPKRPKEKDRRVPRLTLAQLELLLEAVLKTWYPERNLAIILLMADSGLRRGEVAALDRDNVFLQEEYVYIAKAKMDKSRDVPLGESTCTALRRWLVVRPEVAVPALFISRQKCRMSGSAIQQMVYKLRDAVGVKRLYPHLLRHTFANLYLQAHGDLRTLKDMLGHSDVATTARFYVEPNLEDLKEKHEEYSPMSQLTSRG